MVLRLRRDLQVMEVAVLAMIGGSRGVKGVVGCRNVVGFVCGRWEHITVGGACGVSSRPSVLGMLSLRELNICVGEA